MLVRLAGLVLVGLSGCLHRSPSLPQGHLPVSSPVVDERTATVLLLDSAPPLPRPTVPPEKKDAKPFELPLGLPGAATPIARPPKFTKDTPVAERLKLVREGYPELTPVSATIPQSGATLTLAELQQIARTNSPVIRRAEADARDAYGQVIQAGLPPNPTVGYEADQVTPGPHPPLNNSGQQGAYVNQLIKFPGKLSLAQAVAGFDYTNSYVAVRRAQMDVTTAVRSNYFQVLMAQKGMEINRLLAGLADEVYQIQLKQVVAGEAAGYEPLQLYAQAVQARNALAQTEAANRANWRQLAAALGQPDLPQASLAGRVDQPAPVMDLEQARIRVTEAHTEVLTARNRILQAEVNLRLQKLTRAPDIATNFVTQRDNALRLNQFNLQVGLVMPFWDRNQGNIRSAQARIASAMAALAATENDLISRLADAYGRYEANRVMVSNYRDKILPALTQAYQGLIRRHQLEPDKVGLNDIVVAQQNLAQALQAYLTALNSQWQAVTDLANLLQTDELYTEEPLPVVPEKK